MKVMYAADVHDPVRFSDIEDHVGVSAPTISVRLDELENERLLERTFYDEMPPRVEYSPMGEGGALAADLTGVFEWAADMIEHGPSEPADEPLPTDRERGRDSEERRDVADREDRKDRAYLENGTGSESTGDRVNNENGTNACVYCRTGEKSETDGSGPDAEWYRTIDGLIDVLEKTYAIEIVGYLGAEGTDRYSGIKERVGATSDTSLSTRLQKFVDAGLVNRQSHDEVPPNVQYSLTRAGQNLETAIRPLMDWKKT